MFADWKEHYSLTKGRTVLAGWAFESVSACRVYFANRVMAKLQEANAAAMLEDYLREMADTGFDTSALMGQVQAPPVPKDWEIGELFAAAMLEDRFDAAFPWPTAWDKRTPKASLPGPDMPGFERTNPPRFLFGEVKSSSQQKTPPDAATSGDDSLCKQIGRLLTSPALRQQLVQWLLIRTQDAPRWRPILDEAIQRYTQGNALICGVLVRGKRPPTVRDLSPVQDDVAAIASSFDVRLFAFYLPCEMADWIKLLYPGESPN